MPTVFDVADYFIAAATPEEGITNLKLQKMCSYAQAVSLAYLGAPLFTDDRIQAWPFGPVIPSLYRKYAKWDRSPIDPAKDKTHALKEFTNTQRLILATVQEYCGRFSAWGLQGRSHEDFPGDFGSKEVILNEDIAAAFADNHLVLALKEADDFYGALET